jgi:hypothetical protein
VGNRNRRAEPTTNKVKRRLSLTLTGRPPVSPRSESQRMFCEHVGLFRLSSAEAARTYTPHCRPLRARKAEQQKTKKQLRSTTVSTPRLLMAAIKSITSVPILGITCPPHSSTDFPSASCSPVLSHLSASLLFLAPISCPDSGLPVLVSTSGTISLSRAISVASMHPSHFVLSLRLWVYHRDFGATPSVIYGK